MRLDALTSEQCEHVRRWRNLDTTPYRTPYMFTEEMQADFYNSVVCNRNADSRYFSVMDDSVFVAMVGLVTISLENRSAELSIVVDTDSKGRGVGTAALRLLLRHGFMVMNLDNIFGECYSSSPSYSWWIKIIEADKFMTYSKLPRRKYYNGRYHDSIYFNFTKESIYNDDI